MAVNMYMDNPAFSGRFRDFGRGSHFTKPKAQPVRPRGISDIYAAQPRVQSPAKPATLRQTRSQVLQRNITAKPVARKRRKPVSQKLLPAMATIVFVAGITVAVIGLRTNKHVEAQIKNASQQNGQNAVAPDEEKPSAQAMANYKVDPTAPRYVRIAKLNVFSRVTRQGLDAKGAIKAPTNVHDVGWYENSSKPGEGGATLLDSHVSGPTVKGAFFGIKNLAAGDMIEVERGDGQKFNYQVVKSVVADADKVDMASALVSVQQGKPGLNMITCTGKFNPQTQEYQQRVVVYAVQV